MEFYNKNWKGIFTLSGHRCSMLVPRTDISDHRRTGIRYPFAGMIITLLLKDKSMFQNGITFVSKKVLQYAVILLGFGLNLSVILETGKQSLPIIVTTISTSLIICISVTLKLCMYRGNISTLVGVGSSICGGSAICRNSTGH